MSDQIINCTKCIDSNGNIDHYDILFSFDALESLPSVPVVTLEASELINPTDLTEVKTKACTKASVIKATYIYQSSLVYSQIIDLNGPVTL